MTSPLEDDVRQIQLSSKQTNPGMADVAMLQTFEKLKQKADPNDQKLRDEAYNARLHAQYEAQQKRIEALV